MGKIRAHGIGVSFGAAQTYDGAAKSRIETYFELSARLAFLMAALQIHTKNMTRREM